MKKLLLLSASIILAASVRAQNKKSIKPSELHSNVLYKMGLEPSPSLINANRNYVKSVHSSKMPSNSAIAATSVTNKDSVGSSVNVFGDLISESNNLNADNNLGLVVRDHRANSSYVNNFTAGSGDYNVSFTTAYCSGTWDSTRVVSNPMSTNWGINLRYPTGAIYNPPGNTIPTMAYAVGSGPFNIGGVWKGGYFTSGRLDVSTYDNLDTIFSANDSTNQMPRVSSCATDLGNYHVLGSYFDWNTATGNIDSLIAYKSAFNNTTNHFNHPVGTFLDVSHDNVVDFGVMAFSQDGLTGYVAVSGHDTANSCQPNVMPIIWKTIDAGITWNRLPFYDFRNIPGMDTALAGQATIPNGNYLPFFSSSEGWDATVDKWGNLHLIALVYGSIYDDLNCDGDSTDLYVNQHIVDLYGNGTSWAAYKITNLLSVSAGAVVSPWINAGAGVALFARLQIGRSQDGSRIFYAWVDTDTTLSLINIYPDIHVSGMNVDTWMAAPETNVTAGTLWAEHNFFLYLSSTELGGAGTYTIPMTTTEPWDTTAPGAADVEHMAVCGVTMQDVDFTIACRMIQTTGVTTVNSLTANSVSQNHPNPFTGMTSFDLTIAHTATVSVDVTNYLGQVVYSFAERKYEAGIHKVDMDLSQLNAGLYFYTVKIGGESVSRKMMVY